MKLRVLNQDKSRETHIIDTPCTIYLSKNSNPSLDSFGKREIFISKVVMDHKVEIYLEHSLSWGFYVYTDHSDITFVTTAIAVGRAIDNLVDSILKMKVSQMRYEFYLAYDGSVSDGTRVAILVNTNRFSLTEVNGVINQLNKIAGEEIFFYQAYDIGNDYCHSIGVPFEHFQSFKDKFGYNEKYWEYDGQPAKLAEICSCKNITLILENYEPTCKYCHGTGKITLLTSVVSCECQKKA